MDISVFCGSSMDSTCFNKEFEQLGKIIASNNANLIYGGGFKGYMGVLAKSVLDEHGVAVGIIPEQFNDETKVDYNSEGNYFIVKVNSVEERKNIMLKSDLIIIAPGSYGTLDEIATTLLNIQASKVKVPIIILNFDSFYTDFIKFLYKVEESNIGDFNILDSIIIEPSIYSLGLTLEKFFH